jgi:phage major head subunit gpT-like protein
MPAITPQFLYDLESNMQHVTEREYSRLTQNLFWSKVAKAKPSVTRREVFTWLLETAQIEDQGGGGVMGFEDLVILMTEIENRHAGKGLRLRRDQFEDHDGNGVELATEWSGQMGAQSAYWPQKLLCEAIRTNPVGYDGLTYFNVAHPYNPFDAAAGTYANLFTGGTAAPIDGVGVTLEIALNNIARVMADIRSIRQANGIDPRYLKPAFILNPPALTKRVAQLTDAKFIAASAGVGAGGAADIEGVIRSFGLAQPIEVPEFQATALYPEGDTTFYVACEQLASSGLGAFVYSERLPFSITYYSGHGGSGATGVDALLSRTDQLEWHTKGRNAVMPGHPYLLFKVMAA